MSETAVAPTNKMTKWLLAFLPLLILIALVVAFLTLNPLTFFTATFPP
jgi:hypothetical protein